MSDLTAVLNDGREQVPTTVMLDPFHVEVGDIPSVVSLLRDDGRVFAGGSVVLAERLRALRSGDAEQISAWCSNYFDLADACITFEDQLKAQSDSSLLTGIRGVVGTSDGSCVAVDAAAVSRATNDDMRYFPVMDSETVSYGVGAAAVSRPVQSVVLLKYHDPYFIELSGDQFTSVAVKAVRRPDFVHGRDMEESELVSGGVIIHPVYRALWPAELVVPLVSETFRFNREEHGCNTSMGVYLAREPQGSAKMRAFCAGRLDYWSRLVGGYGIGDDDLRLLGVVESGAAGAAKK